MISGEMAAEQSHPPPYFPEGVADSSRPPPRTSLPPALAPGHGNQGSKGQIDMGRKSRADHPGGRR